MSPASTTRRQLTLFVAEPWRSRLQDLRLSLDPVQASLIAAHVTLCRENEIATLDPSTIAARVEAWMHGALRLSFGPAQRFNGHGVLLPCAQGAAQFHALRQWLRQDPTARERGAHVTLAHPRNPRADGNTEAALAACPPALELQFAAVSLIEQQGATPWTVLQQTVLGRARHRAVGPSPG